MLLYKLTVSGDKDKKRYNGWFHTFTSNEDLIHYVTSEKPYDIYILDLEIIYEI